MTYKAEVDKYHQAQEALERFMEDRSTSPSFRIDSVDHLVRRLHDLAKDVYMNEIHNDDHINIAQVLVR